MPYLEVNDSVNAAASHTLFAVCQRLSTMDQEFSEMRSQMTNYSDQKEAMAAMAVEITGEVIHYNCIGFMQVLYYFSIFIN